MTDLSLTQPTSESDWFTFHKSSDVQVGFFLGDVVAWSRKPNGESYVTIARASHKTIVSIPSNVATGLLEAIRRFHRRSAA